MTLGIELPLDNDWSPAGEVRRAASGRPRGVPDLGAQTDLLRKSEEFGFSAVWMRDVPVFDQVTMGDAGSVHDIFVLLGYLAGITRRMALGTAAVVLPIRHPMMTAKVAASVDMLSGGRLILGVASGDRSVEYPLLGLDFEKRGETLRQPVGYLRAAWQPGGLPVEGDRVPQLDLLPRPVQPTIPLVVAGQAQQDGSWLAAHMDGRFVYPSGVERLRAQAESWAEATADRSTFISAFHLDLDSDASAPLTPSASAHGADAAPSSLISRSWPMQVSTISPSISGSRGAYLPKFSMKSRPTSCRRSTNPTRPRSPDQSRRSSAMQTVTAHGATIPALGFGVFRMSDAEVERVIPDALEAGFRHFDTAQIYQNEAALGRALERAGARREDLFLTTKVWVDNYNADTFAASVDESLDKLKVDQVGLLLLHWPADKVPVGTQIEMLNAVQAAGKTRFIGVSNQNIAQVRESIKRSKVPIVTNQVELHPYLPQHTLVAAAKNSGVAVTAYYSMADGAVPKDPILQQIGAKYGKSAAQIGLRWLVQQGYVALTKTANSARVPENIAIFDFALDEADMAAIDKLARPDGRLVSPPGLAPAWDA